MPDRKVRLVLHTDSIAQSDVYTFQSAGMFLAKEYRSKYPKDTVVIQLVRSGREIVSVINNQLDESIISLDIISHGNQGGIHIARRLRQPVTSGIIQRRIHVSMRQNTAIPQDAEEAKFIEESIHGLYSDWLSKVGVAYYYNQTYENSHDIATLGDIDYSKLSEDSVVEFHGCRTAELIVGWNAWFKDNFAENFSEKLGNNGIVIGHIHNAAPNHPKSKHKDDYRYGKVRVYRDGILIQDSVERWGMTFEKSSSPLLQ